MNHRLKYKIIKHIKKENLYNLAFGDECLDTTSKAWLIIGKDWWIGHY